LLKLNNIIIMIMRHNFTSKFNQMKKPTISCYGLVKFGYVCNLKDHMNQFNYLLEGTGKKMTDKELDTILSKVKPVNYNSKGHSTYKNKPITDEFAVFRVINTGEVTANGDEICGIFQRKYKTNRYEGVTWCGLNDIVSEILLMQKPHMGEMVFANLNELESYLSNIAENAVKEPWSFGPPSSQTGYPILKSYLDNIFVKLKKEATEGIPNKIVYSEDNQHILFNTNLPDMFGNDILIIADVKKMRNGLEYYENPRMNRGGLLESMNCGFKKGSVPEPASFFEDVNEVIFQSNWDIDANYDKLFHIIQDNRSRFPKEFQSREPSQIASDLEKAIKLATKMSKRNFKYIAPMYRPQKDCIQLLMPIYLSGSLKTSPDFALVLTPVNGLYVPETILPIRNAYQDARLIAMPDEAWLKPETISASSEVA